MGWGRGRAERQRPESEGVRLGVMCVCGGGCRGIKKAKALKDYLFLLLLTRSPSSLRPVCTHDRGSSLGSHHGLVEARDVGGGREGKEGYQSAFGEENPRVHSVLLFLSPRRSRAPVSQYSSILGASHPQRNNTRCSSMRPTPAGRPTVPGGHRGFLRSCHRIAWIWEMAAAAAPPSLKNKKQNSCECRPQRNVCHRARDCTVPHSSSSSSTSSVPLAGTAPADVWVCHRSDWLKLC